MNLIELLPHPCVRPRVIGLAYMPFIIFIKCFDRMHFFILACLFRNLIPSLQSLFIFLLITFSLSPFILFFTPSTFIPSFIYIYFANLFVVYICYTVFISFLPSSISLFFPRFFLLFYSLRTLFLQ
jgi:hypothetical protein